MSKTAPFVWAQRRDRVLLTIHLRDVTNEKIELTPDHLTFEGTSDKNTYTGQVNFYKEIDVEASKKTILGYGIRFVLFKKEKEESYWPRLTKEGGKHNNIQSDWEKYIDSDEENEKGDKGLDQNWNPDMMQNFGGNYGGQGGEGADDSDDEEPQVNDLDGEEELQGGDKKEEKQDEEVKQEN
ncbi:prostaglandin e, putative [Ichthyophthirius multifiliis]|uniref:Prostaglandin e, putative n=1 Tax=Ichthyophthirius multifiliis TaxID=5932 RepID=G0R665_ICHMU|nr:prostaglandin e, putative [Ichthyophthirius multifiliis]EGR27029.1 prostaglandin e, putative [Ichthyophthirius multifiliis]|eukprot:XP_004023913.1 prostaglandin e, putative [Ichthyophthirius multifiliis]